MINLINHQMMSPDVWLVEDLGKGIAVTQGL